MHDSTMFVFEWESKERNWIEWSGTKRNETKRIEIEKKENKSEYKIIMSGAKWFLKWKRKTAISSLTSIWWSFIDTFKKWPNAACFRIIFPNLFRVKCLFISLLLLFLLFKNNECNIILFILSVMMMKYGKKEQKLRENLIILFFSLLYFISFR